MSDRFLSEYDHHLLAEGQHYRSFEKMGAHIFEQDGNAGVHFAVWAPNAERVSVIGDWNDWKEDVDTMEMKHGNGIWECFVPGVGHGNIYKYAVVSKFHNFRGEKA